MPIKYIVTRGFASAVTATAPGADINSWAGTAFPLSGWVDDYDPGVDTGLIVTDKLVSITIIRNGVAQDAQIVRVEELRGDREIQTAAGVTARVDALVIGYKGHPTVADTDIQRGDRFAIAGELYEVVSLVPGLTDGVQAYIRVKS